MCDVAKYVSEGKVLVLIETSMQRLDIPMQKLQFSFGQRCLHFVLFTLSPITRFAAYKMQ